MISNNCLENFRPSFYKRYVDDTFLLFRDEQQAQLFFQYVNDMHNSVKFIFEGEADNTFPFLDVNVRRTTDQFVTSVFRKPTFGGLSTSYFSSMYFKYKAACLVTLFFRAFRISSTYEIFHVEVEKLRTLFTNNLHPSKYFNSILHNFPRNKYEQPAPNFDVSK